LNNKELPVKQYEPFFSATEEYEFEDEVVATGVSSTVYYDPPGRATKVKLPNGCLRRVLFDAWKQEFWDENDCAADSDCTADSGLTARAADHTETPTKIHLDHLGRPVATEEYAEQEGDAIWTVLTLDVAGNPTAITDARSIVTQAQVFDMLGRPIHSISPDAGNSTVFLDVAGQPLRIWKSGDLQIDFGYDDLRRKTKTLVTEGSATPRLVEVNEYGESEGTTLNHRGRLWRQWDTAGRVEVDAYDFKGNPLSSTRRFWDWEAEGEQVTWGESLADTPSDSLLEAEEFTVEQSFDALNRPTTQTTPDGSITEIGYNQAALFESIGVKLRGSATLTPFVIETTYNARGQREQIDYGNGVSTGYNYDADTFRLNTLETWRESDGLRYQKLAFTYDPVGNIVGIEDGADSTNHTGLATTLYFANGAVTADQDFTYDALYRLTEA
ncbi:MAG TPA: toxin, partial [Myxococcota bacterium]|nr:toxin [Myxococcota bacterium]